MPWPRPFPGRVCYRHGQALAASDPGDPAPVPEHWKELHGRQSLGSRGMGSMEGFFGGEQGGFQMGFATPFMAFYGSLTVKDDDQVLELLVPFFQKNPVLPCFEYV